MPDHPRAEGRICGVAGPLSLFPEWEGRICAPPFLLVILNLFQNPFLTTHETIGFVAHRAARWCESAYSVETAEWVLKQGQDDE